MQGFTTERTTKGFVVTHPLDPEDAAITAAMRAMLSSSKGARPGIEARGQYDALMERVLPREDVTFEEDTLGGVPGLWVLPADSRSSEVIVHLHGGWFSLGSAKAYRHLVGHIAARAAARTFIPDYRLAPEHPFPAATDDVWACYQGLAAGDVHRIALTGDSAGGNLALGLASRVTAEAASINATLVGVAVLSPVTDLTLSGASDGMNLTTDESEALLGALMSVPIQCDTIHYMNAAVNALDWKIRDFDVKRDSEAVCRLDTSFTSNFLYEVRAEAEAIHLEMKRIHPPREKRFQIELKADAWQQGYVATVDGVVHGFVAMQFSAWNRRMSSGAQP